VNRAIAGLGAAALVALAAEVAARVLAGRGGGQPPVPAVVLALALGALIANALASRPARAALAPGLDLVKKHVLRVAIVVYGLGIAAGSLRQLGLRVAVVVVACLVLSLAVAALLGRAFGVSRRVSVLLGCGTAICGATAVVTIAPLVGADDDEVAFAIATIFLFNLVALFAFPFLGRAIGLDDASFGVWVGTAVNDTSAVVATGAAYSSDAGALATLVKVVRTLALVPLALGVAALAARTEARRPDVSIAKIFPWFVVGFAAAAVVAVAAPLPEWLPSLAKRTAAVLITGVLAAVGLHLDLRKTLGAGARSLALGFAIAAVVAGASLAITRALFTGGAVLADEARVETPNRALSLAVPAGWKATALGAGLSLEAPAPAGQAPSPDETVLVACEPAKLASVDDDARVEELLERLRAGKLARIDPGRRPRREKTKVGDRTALIVTYEGTDDSGFPASLRIALLPVDGRVAILIARMTTKRLERRDADLDAILASFVVAPAAEAKALAARLAGGAWRSEAAPDWTLAFAANATFEEKGPRGLARGGVFEVVGREVRLRYDDGKTRSFVVDEEPGPDELRSAGQLWKRLP